MTGLRKSLDPKLLEQAVREIGDLAEGENVTVALIGGYALQFFGSTRLTGDIDLIADAPIQELEPSKGLSFGGQRTVAPNGVPADIVVRDDDFRELYEDALDHVTDAGAPIPIVQPEYIAAMKLVAGRRRDFDDLEFLIRQGVIDVPKTKQIIRTHLGPYAAREFQAFVDEVQWRASRDTDG
jgi:hypothetical protein